MAPKSPDYHDSPEYRKSLHLQGEEKEAMLASLRARLGMSGAAAGVSKDVKQHQGVETGSAGGESMAKAEDGYAYAASASSSYSYSSSSSATYEEPTTTPYETTTTYESTTTYEAPTTTYEAPTTTYEAPTEAPYDEPPSYTEPQDGDSGADMGGQAPASSMGGGHPSPSSDEKHELETSHNPSLINF